MGGFRYPLERKYMPGKTEKTASNEVNKAMAIKEIAMSKIDLQKDFDRSNFINNLESYRQGIKELAISIKENGLLQPVILIQKPRGRYELRAGKRRFHACQELNWKSIPAIVRQDGDNLALTLIENLDREELNAIDRGDWLIRIVDTLTGEGKTKEEIMKYLSSKTGKAPKTIYGMMSVARNATPEQRAALASGETTKTDLISKQAKKGNRTVNPAQQLRRKGKAFITQSDKIMDTIKFITTNRNEFRTDRNMIAKVKKLQGFVDVLLNELTKED